MIIKYGNLKLIDLYKKYGKDIVEVYRKQNIDIPDNIGEIKVRSCISIDGGYKILIDGQFENSIHIMCHFAPISKFSSLHDDIILKAFGIQIEQIKVKEIGYARYRIEIPDDLLCTYDNGKFLSLKEMEELLDCKNARQSLQFYHDELSSWDCYG